MKSGSISTLNGQGEENEPERCSLKGETHGAEVKGNECFQERGQEWPLLLRSEAHRNRFRHKDFTGALKEIHAGN